MAFISSLKTPNTKFVRQRYLVPSYSMIILFLEW